MKRTRAAVALCGLALAVIGLTGCTSAVAGSGKIDSSVAAPDSSDTDAPDSSDTDSPAPSDSDEPSPSDSGGSTDGTEPASCEGGKVVAPPSAPYCYVVPDGTQQLSDVTLPGGGKFTTAVGVSDTDVIAVTTFPTTVDTDTLSDDELQKATDQVVSSELSGQFTLSISKGERLTVDGQRTLHYRGKAKSQPIEIDFYFAYKDKDKVQVNCQYGASAKAKITAACSQLLDSMRLS